MKIKGTFLAEILKERKGGQGGEGNHCQWDWTQWPNSSKQNFHSELEMRPFIQRARNSWNSKIERNEPVWKNPTGFPPEGSAAVEASECAPSFRKPPSSPRSKPET